MRHPRLIQTKAGPKPSPSLVPHRLLQRKCACGGASGPTGECAQCRRKHKLGKAAQPKLQINEPGDRYEQEADRIAGQVLRMPEEALQRMPGPITSLVQRQLSEEEEQLQAKDRRSDLTVAGAPAADLASLQERGGEPLPERVRAFMEPRFGHDFSKVRIHADTRAAETARALNARAFTVGNNIVFGNGEFALRSAQGSRLLAHELAHVVQQRSTGDQVQRMSLGSGSPPHSDYSEVPTEEEETVNAAKGLIERVVNKPKDYPGCHKFFKDNCTGGTDGTLKDKFDKATIWFDKDNTVWGSGVDPDHIAYSSETWRWGRWSLAGVFIHEMMHRCGQDDEGIDDRAIVTCGFPDITKHKAGKSDSQK